MSQDKVKYAPENGYATAQTLEAFKTRPCSLPFWHPEYKPPEPEEVDALIRAAGWSQRIAAMIVGVKWSAKGSETIRRWRAKKTDPEYRQIPYSAWRLFLEYAGVVTVEEGLRDLAKYS